MSGMNHTMNQKKQLVPLQDIKKIKFKGITVTGDKTKAEEKITIKEMKEILSAFPDDSILTSGIDGFTMFVTSNFNKDIKSVSYHSLFIGMKNSPLIWTEVNEEIKGETNGKSR